MPETELPMSVVEAAKDEQHEHHPLTLEDIWHIILDYSLPLLSGIFVALIWANADNGNYEYMFGKHHAWSPGHPTLWGHEINISFLVNDIFMVFFFGLASAEVVEAFLPGGSLDPPSKALNPVVACIGGVVGPVSCFFILAFLFHSADMFDDHSFGAVARGWGIPTATDIALAWMVASQVFVSAKGVHPAVNYLLLMAVIDDAIGLVIIAVFYTDPNHPPKPIWLLLLIPGMVFSYLCRHFKVKYWQAYVLFGGVPCWVALIKAGIHPALTLIPVVPFMPEHIDEEAKVAPEPEPGTLTATPNDALSPSRDDDKKDEEIAEMADGPEKEAAEVATDLRETLKQVFDKIDTDHNGTLDVQEVTDFMHSLGHDNLMAHHEVEDELRTIHHGADGGISFEEFFEWYTHKTSGSPSKGSQPGSPSSSKGSSPTLKPRKISRRLSFDTVLRNEVKLERKRVRNKRPKVRSISFVEKTHGSDVSHAPDHEPDGPLYNFEHTCKVPVDCGLFFFSLCNAGVELSEIGAMTACVLLSLIFGKMFGVVGFALAAEACGAPVPKGISRSDLWMVGLIASLGLTVALFVAGQAFTNKSLESQAKMGALLSGLVGFLCVALHRLREDEETKKRRKSASENYVRTDWHEAGIGNIGN